MSLIIKIFLKNYQCHSNYQSKQSYDLYLINDYIYDACVSNKQMKWLMIILKKL